MPQYLLSLYQPDGPRPEPDALAKIRAELDVLAGELRARNAWVFAAGLHGPGTATVVQPRGGDVLITDGPFTEGKEHLGGITVITAPDLDDALGWAGRYARATGLPVEVRPVLGQEESG